MLFSLYPYHNFADYNLDWIIKEIKKYGERLNDFIILNTIKYADPLQWDITTQYEQNTVVIDPQTGDAYLSVRPVPSGVSLKNEDYWTKIFNYSGRMSVGGAFVFPQDFGAIGNGTADDTQAWQDAIDYVAENGGEIHGYGNSRYLITAPLKIPYSHPVSINGANTTIIVGADISTVFKIGDNPTNRDYDAGMQKPMIHHLLITNDGQHHAQYLATIATGVKDYEFHNIISYGTVNGMRIGDGVNRMIPADTQIHDCLFYGNGAEYDSCGFICYNSDNVFDNLRIYGFQRGFDFYTSSQVFNVHVLLRWHDQTMDNFYPYPFGGTEWNTYYPKTSFADLHTQAVVPFRGCYHDGIHTFLNVFENASRIEVNSLFFLGHSGANTGGADLIDPSHIDQTEKIVHISISDAYLNFSGSDRASYGIKCGQGEYLSRFSNVILNNIEISGYGKLANACDLILAGTENYKTKFNAFVANEWVVVGAIANVKNKTRAVFNFELNCNPFEIEFDVTANNTLTWIYDRSLNQQSDVTFGFWYSAQFNAMFICVKIPNTSPVHCKIDLVSCSSETTVPFLVLPCYASTPQQTDPYIHTLLLSELTNDSPLTATYSRPLKNFYPVNGAAANVTIPANGMTDVAITYLNAGRDVDAGIFFLNQTINHVAIVTAYNVTRTGANIRLHNSSGSEITIPTLMFVGLLFKK